METRCAVRSPDGVEIAYYVSGSGPYLVLVHGTGADHTRWRYVLPMFEERFTVCAVDRRGRGGSGDSKEFSLEAEFKDITAVCDSLDGPVNLLGHSYGAICALEAAIRSQNVARLVLYEPPICMEGGYTPPEVRSGLEEMLAKGDREGVLTTFFREVAGVSETALEAMRQEPAWQGRLAAARTIPREFEDENYVLDAERLGGMTAPALLLLGGESPRFFRVAIEAVHAALPNSEVAILPGQEHVAITTAPEMFAAEVLRFLVR